MTIDQLSRNDAIRLFSTIHNKEELLRNKQYYLSDCREGLKKCAPKPRTSSTLGHIISFCLRMGIFMYAIFAAAAIAVTIYMLVPNMPDMGNNIVFGVALILIFILLIIFRKAGKKIRHKNAKNANPEFEALRNEIYNTEYEIDALKDEIEKLYNSANIKAPYKHPDAMYYLANRLRNLSSCTVVQALRDYDEALRAEAIADAKAEAIKSASAAVADEISKSRAAFESAEKDRYDMEQRNLGVHGEILDRLNYMSDKM